MTTRAKVAPLGENVAAASEAEVATNGVIQLTRSSDVALDIAPEEVAGYVKDGADLLVQLKDGETLRIANFYAQGQPPSHLYLVDDHKLVSVDLPVVASDGPLVASYEAQEVLAGFESLTSAQAAAAAAGTTAGGISTAGWVLGGLALAGGAAALSGGGGGGGGNGGGETPPPTPPPPTDTTPPAAASNLLVSADGTRLTGNAEPGARVGIDLNGDGRADITVVAGADGRFEATLSPPLVNGETLSVVVTDAAGNSSPPASVTAPDITAPPAASELTVADDGSSVSGSAEAGSTVTIDLDGDGQPDITVIAGPDGRFEAALDPPLTNGETITVVVTDPAGNSSAPITATAPDTTAPAPAGDVQINGDGTVVSGSAEPGATVTLDIDGDGQPDITVIAGPDGRFEAPLDPPLTNGETVTVIVTDPAGNSSAPITATAPDTTAPAPAADVQISGDGALVSGSAEPGASVGIDIDGDGQPDITVIAGPDGRFEAALDPPLTDGQTVSVTVTDPAGNSSAPVSLVAPDFPAPPVINPSNGSSISGTAEPGVTITLTDGAGNPIGQTTADGDGAWSFTPATPLADGTVVQAVASEAGGTPSPPASVIVDGVAPAAPAIDASNGAVISGTAEPGSTVTLTDGAGDPIGEVIADGEGNWSFTPGTPLPDGTVVNAVATDPSGNTGTPASTTVDAVAPGAPSVGPSNGSGFSGTAEPNSTVVLTDSDGNVIGQAAVDATGTWTFTADPAVADGAVVTVTARDAAGNESAIATVTVDGSAPSAPVIDASNGATLSGTAEPNSTVILTDGNGNPIGQVDADGAGVWSFTPAPPLADGTLVNAVAVDASGNASGTGSTVVDATPPAAPVVAASNGGVITGTAEPNSTVTLTDGNGDPIGEVGADGAGNWSFTPATPLPDGTVITAVAVDAAGNASQAGIGTVDAVPPPIPTVGLSNGSSFTGTAEPNSTVVLTDGAGTPIAEVGVDADGNWSYTPGTALPDGSVVEVAARDAAGNLGPAASVTVDGAAPATPVITATNGITLSGTAEPNSTVTLTDGNGAPIGQVEADGAGVWSFTPSTPLANGTVVNATATDAAGNTGPTASTVVDSVAPASPALAVSNGSVISGTAEPGSTVILTDGNGDPIGEVTADAAGTWSFTPATPLADGTVVNAVAEDAAGNQSPAVSTVVDAVAPAVPSVDPSNGSSLSGSADPNSTVVLADAQGNILAEIAVDGSGTWSYTPVTALPDGTVVTVSGRDAAGNTSGGVNVTIDGLAPAAPIVAASNGTTLSGTAEPNSTVILTDGNGTLIGQVDADGTGAWSFSPATPLPEGTLVNAVARDASGNNSPTGSTVVDATPPAAPVVNAGNGSVISGTAEPGSTVILTDGNGDPIGEATADANGIWSFTPATPLDDGTVVNAVAEDAAGNQGAQGGATVDALAPAVPTVDASNGVTLSGTAEPNSTVVLTDAAGNPIADVTADASGAWSYTPATPLLDGAVVTVGARDAAGNEGPTVQVTIDALAPAAPLVDASNGGTLSGTAEPNSSISITDGAGNLIAQVTADGAGAWSYTPGTALPNGTVVNVTATDAAGNTSATGTTVVDAIAPTTPTLALGNGTVLSGTGEPGSTIVLATAGGTPIGEAQVGADGTWSFTPASPLDNGTLVVAVAEDAAGNQSGPASTTIDAVAPGTPGIGASNGVSFDGTADPGSTVVLTGPDGTTLAEILVGDSGTWSYTPVTALPDGAVVTVSARDAAGNSSGTASVTVDAIAPGAPVVTAGNGSVISGSAEPNSTVTLIDGAGNPIAQVSADANGAWSYTPATPLPDGTVIVASATDASGNTGATGAGVVDSLPPGPPVVNAGNGSVLTGTAEPLSTVILTDGNGDPIGQVDADAQGNWSFTPATPLPDGTVVNAIAEDAAGNQSGQGSGTVDALPPATPVVEASNGSSLNGTADPGSIVVLTDASGTVIVEVTADADGFWSYTPGTALPDGTVVTVSARDAAGNTSGDASVTVDASAPPAPVLVPSNGAVVSGSAEPNSTVTLTDNAGNPIAQVDADGNGLWSFIPITPLPNGAVVIATATDASGNTGPASATVVDALAPPPPLLSASNGTLISGTAEPNVTVILTDGDGNPIGEATADAAGNWSFAPATALADGTVINASAVDAAGNISTPPVTTTVDAVAPGAPLVNPSNGVVINGTAEAGSTVTLTTADGTPIGQVLTDGTGHWTFTPAAPLPDGTVIVATATDAAGNEGLTGSNTVDTSLPSIPQIDPSRGETISGTADPGTTVSIDDGSGAPPVQVLVDGDGNWSYTPGTPYADGTVIEVTATNPGGTTSAPAQVIVDGLAPAAPVVNASNGSEITGSAEAGATILLTDGNGDPIGQTVAAADGTWQFTPGTPLPDGTTINATATDAAGNVSGVGTGTVDAIDPATPVINASNGTVITGTAEAGTTVLLTDAAGTVLGQAVVDINGTWAFAPATPLASGTVVSAVARDAAGNESGPATTTVDTTAPAAPVINASNGVVISGTAEANAKVILTDGAGTAIGVVTADGNGVWTFAPGTALANGTLVRAVAQDAAGNTSSQVSTTVDTLPPPTPVINASNGSVLAGTAEANATVVLTGAGGTPIATVTADASGNWSYTPGTPLANGTLVNAVAQDAAGNSSAPASTTVDQTPPAVPVINASNGSVIAGTAEAGVKVILTDGAGNPIATVTADANGNWSLLPATPLANGTVINAAAQDAAGNLGPSTSTTVDSVPPPAVVINATNGVVIAGTAEANAKVILTDGSGTAIGTALADGNGVWSFTVGTPLANGSVVKAVAQDAAGNTGPSASTTVDTLAPATPVITASNGSVLTGTAEANATVVLTDGTGAPIGTATADAAGVWSFTPGTALPNGTVVNAVARDAAGNSSGPATTTVDSVAPTAPVINASNGVVISGTAEANAKVILTDGAGTAIGTATADANGVWSFTPGTALVNGTVINAVAQDAAGNASGPVSTTVDTVAPPAVVINASNGAVVSGTAEANAKVILTNAAGAVIAQVSADANGVWSYTPGTPLPNGTLVKAVAQDAAGNTGPQVSTTVDALAPNAPVINASNGSVVTGTAEANARVILTDGNGTPIATVTADANGNWSHTPATPLLNGTVINAVAQDEAGNSSGQVTTTVDAIAPAAPVINASNGVVITGTAEANAKVILTDGSGTAIGTATAGANGVWSFAPGTALANGTVVNAVAQDAAGNTSATVNTTVDNVAPPVVVINATNGALLNGTAEANAKVILTDGNGAAIGTVTANANGEWSFTPGVALANGTLVKAVAQDAAGNTSAQVSTTVDAVAPAAPVINASNGSVVTGTAEANARVLLTDGNGNPIATVTADASGLWSYTPATALVNGTTVRAVAQDAAGNTSGAVATTIDAVAPNAPVINASNGVVVTGTAEANAKVILTDGSGNAIGTATANGNGVWSFTPAAPLANGTVISAVAQDAAGNTSGTVNTTVDNVAPPAVVINPSNGTVLAGTAEANAKVILTTAAGTVIAQVTADGNGAWSYTPGTPLANGTVVRAVAQDAAGNTGPQVSTTVDTLPPAAPVINASNGSVLTGTAEANAKVILTTAGGAAIGTVTADANGAWSFTPGTPLANGTVVNAVAQDPAGNTSGPVSTTIDAVAPLAPTINGSNGVLVTGSAEAGATVLLTDGSGNVIGQTVANGGGSWSFLPGTPLANGTVITAVARDAAGNLSGPVSTTVDTLPPAAPVINATNGVVITGTAEANAKVVLTTGAGVAIGTVTADANGNWSFSPGTALGNGTVVRAVAQDAAGNSSVAVDAVVDAIAPLAPVINASNGAVITGTGEIGARIVLTSGTGQAIGTAVVDATGKWTFTPGTPLPNGTQINAVAQDAAGNVSGPVATLVDAVAPAAPVINLSNGALVSGTAEAGAKVLLTDANGTVIGQATANGSGVWTFSPGAPLANGTVVNAVAQDAAGNTSTAASTTVDSIAPAAPVLTLSANGALLTGTAEANSKVRIVVNGDAANPITVTADANGTFSVPFSPALVAGQLLTAVAIDAVGNVSPVGTVQATDLAPPTITVPEAADTWINAAEISNGIQVNVGIRSTVKVGQVITLKFAGTNGYEAFALHTVTAADVSAGTVQVTINQPAGQGAFPQGAATIVADIGGAVSAPVGFTVDTIPPPAPVLSLVGNLLTISTEPGTVLTVKVNIGGAEATATVTANNSGIASLNLLTGLNINLTWDQLLSAQLTVQGADRAGNLSPVAGVGVGTGIAQPVTIGNFGVDVSLNPLAPKFGFSGQTAPNSSVVIQVVTPLLNVSLLPITANAAGTFSLNLLSPSVLSQLNLNITQILNLGADISFNLVATNGAGQKSAAYGIDLTPNGLFLNIGQIDVNGTAGDDVLSGANNSAEHIFGGNGNDLVLNIGASDQVQGGAGNDTLQVTSANFTSIDGGAGFDTLLLANGVDIDYNAVGVGIIRNIERIDMGTGDAGSEVTLTAPEVDAITDANNVLQFTGESNDVLNVAGAVNTNTTQVVDGISYNVYSFGNTTLLVEENTVTVVT